MKRFFAFLVSMIFVFSVAFADFDISEMSDEELYSLMNNARLELQGKRSFKPAFTGPPVFRDSFLFILSGQDAFKSAAQSGV